MAIKILSVDDSRTIRLIVGKAFRPYEVTLLEAANGEEGLAVAAREKPDLIILDVTMPVMDGVTMLTKLKEDPDLKAIPVIMLTAESGRENVLQIARLGVRDYLVKPFKEDQLIEKAGRCVTLEKRPVATARLMPAPPDINQYKELARRYGLGGHAGKRFPAHPAGGPPGLRRGRNCARHRKRSRAENPALARGQSRAAENPSNTHRERWTKPSCATASAARCCWPWARRCPSRWSKPFKRCSR